MHRITKHPILEIPERREVTFTWNAEQMTGYEGEMISSALIAGGIHIFGHHHKDRSPQGIFCANGQCSQCMVLADGRPVKACMVPVEPGMEVASCEGLPSLPEDDQARADSEERQEKVIGVQNVVIARRRDQYRDDGER